MIRFWISARAGSRLEPGGEGAGVFQEGAVRGQVPEAQGRQTALIGAEKLAGAAQGQVGFGDAEAVVGLL